MNKSTGGLTQLIIKSSGPVVHHENLICLIRAVVRFKSSCDRELSNSTLNESIGRQYLGEVLFWHDSLDEQLLAKHKRLEIEIGDREYFEAFKLARNQVAHGSWNPLATEVNLGELYSAQKWIWNDIYNSKHVDSRTSLKAEPYVKYLQGKSISNSLDQLLSKLWIFRSWKIPRSLIEQPGFGVDLNLPFDAES